MMFVSATVGVNLASDDINAESAANVLSEVASRAELFTFIRNFNDLLSRVNVVYTNAFCRIRCEYLCTVRNFLSLPSRMDKVYLKEDIFITPKPEQFKQKTMKRTKI